MASSRPAARARCGCECGSPGAGPTPPGRGWAATRSIGPVTLLARARGATEERRPVIDGCEYREALQAVQIEGGVAGNVVPDVRRP